jgi:excisionase family DNA binding protein
MLQQDTDSLLLRYDEVEGGAMDIADLITISEAAQRLSVGRLAIYRAIQRGVLTPVVVGGRQMLLLAQVSEYRPNGYQGRRPRRRRDGRAEKQAASSSSGLVSEAHRRQEGASEGQTQRKELEGIRELTVSDRRSSGKGFCVVGACFNTQGEFQGYPILREGLSEVAAQAMLAELGAELGQV